MKPLPAPRRRDRANSAIRTAWMAHPDQRLRAALASLEQCRAVLVASGSNGTAQLVSMAILELRMKLHRITEAEWKVFCEAIAGERRSSPAPHEPGPP